MRSIYFCLFCGIHEAVHDGGEKSGAGKMTGIEMENVDLWSPQP